MTQCRTNEVARATGVRWLGRGFEVLAAVEARWLGFVRAQKKSRMKGPPGMLGGEI